MALFIQVKSIKNIFGNYKPPTLLNNKSYLNTKLVNYRVHKFSNSNRRHFETMWLMMLINETKISINPNNILSVILINIKLRHAISWNAYLSACVELS